MEAIPFRRLVRGDAGALHDRPIEPVARVEVLQIERSAIVLGSTQSFDVVDAARAAESGFDVVRRRSGGGVVILQPDDHVWIDVTVPRGHALWHDDVERATWWLGEVWCDVLRETVGAERSGPAAGHAANAWSVYREKLIASAPERAVCFASIGPGEVVRSDARAGVSRKVVGISQRRTKDAARFQCTVFHEIDVSRYDRFMRVEVAASLRHAVGVGDALADVGRRAAERVAERLAVTPR
ncbi:MAG: lipoyl protein ligase domain-containing protein [Ilumatobacteraceae bacterium]